MLPLLHDGGGRGGAQHGGSGIALLRSVPLPQRRHVLGGDGAARAAGRGDGGRAIGAAGAAAAARDTQKSQATGTDHRWNRVTDRLISPDWNQVYEYFSDHSLTNHENDFHRRGWIWCGFAEALPPQPTSASCLSPRVQAAAKIVLRALSICRIQVSGQTSKRISKQASALESNFRYFPGFSRKNATSIEGERGKVWQHRSQSDEYRQDQCQCRHHDMKPTRCAVFPVKRGGYHAF